MPRSVKILTYFHLWIRIFNANRMVLFSFETNQNWDRWGFYKMILFVYFKTPEFTAGKNFRNDSRDSNSWWKINRCLFKFCSLASSFSSPFFAFCSLIKLLLVRNKVCMQHELVDSFLRSFTWHTISGTRSAAAMFAFISAVAVLYVPKFRGIERGFANH